MLTRTPDGLALTLDFHFWTMASDNALVDVDPDSQRSCSARMSTLLYDKHSVCVNCRGNECSFEKRCDECSSWEDDIMTKSVRHMKSNLL